MPRDQACYGKKSAFVFDKPGVGYNCAGPSFEMGQLVLVLVSCQDDQN